ncbi:pimeloyl-ACP methyl ester carboxylesterase [Nocardia transvalensis]|uniref:Pimeloyl-ACP methyl ester carboxylesterase n=1 Tax=Nocardia transvalensis TaxID=37333 RepID=A0A7W9PIF4_9NOCA|nr:alpha/beta hydrolase [Nocardia transvalensis]MBB5916288.1 pimeloyl-ACP methyl ester carboxylesterase [Nocardia transvalensis]
MTAPDPNVPYSTVVSTDGTTIAYLTVGAGPPVVVVPGVLAVAGGYLDFARALGLHFTVHVIERRGRDGSGPQGDDYSIDKEREDLLAVCDKTGARFLVGHSYGGLVALETARERPDIRKVAVYEPGLSIDGSVPTAWMPVYERKLAQHKPFDAFVEFTRAMGPESARRAPRWVMRRVMPMLMEAPERTLVTGLLAENLREHREIVRLDNTYPRYQDIDAEVLFLQGGKDHTPQADIDRATLEYTIPRCTGHLFPDLDHFGLDKHAPQRVAGVINTFFSG